MKTNRSTVRFESEGCTKVCSLTFSGAVLCAGFLIKKGKQISYFVCPGLFFFGTERGIQYHVFYTIIISKLLINQLSARPIIKANIQHF